MKKLFPFLLFACLINLSVHAYWGSRSRDMARNVHAGAADVQERAQAYMPQATMPKQMKPMAHEPQVSEPLSEEDIKPKSFMVETNFRYFRPGSCVLQDIYGKSWIDYQVKVSGSLMPNKEFWSRLYTWFAINYTGNSGKSINGLEPTKIQLVPISFGFRFVEPIHASDGIAEVYLGAGLKYYFLEIQNKTLFAEQCISKNKLGGVVEGGVYFLAGENVAFNIMFDYSFVRFSCPKSICIQNVQPFALKGSGLSVGGGIGFRF